MAKKQTRRSISVSRGTYERLKAYCETNQISMSQFVERRVGDYLGRSGQTPGQIPAVATTAKTPVSAPAPQAVRVDAFQPPTQPPTQPQSPTQAQLVAKPRTDAFQVGTPGEPVTPAGSRMSSINQPLSQAVGAPRSPMAPKSDEPLIKDPDAKLTADQIFTF